MLDRAFSLVRNRRRLPRVVPLVNGGQVRHGMKSLLGHRFESAAVGVVACALSAVAGVAQAADGAKETVFNRDIRPILADRCFKCHGPDAGQRKAKLRLDNARDAMSRAESGNRAIVAGKADESELYRRITSDD